MGTQTALIFSFIVLLLSACSTATKTASSDKSGIYSEDLSGLRTAFFETDEDTVAANTEQQIIENVDGAAFEINKQLSYVLDSINVLNKNNKFVEGFAIQIYSGINREDAMNAKGELARKLPEITSELLYTQPSFKVKVGKYYSKLEAQPDYQLIKRYFTNAILVPERIYIDEQ